MRKLYLLRGLPASGKSTFIKNNHLEQYTISTDEIRKLYCSADNKWDFNENRVVKAIDQDNDKKVFAMINEILENRFKNENTTIIDATNISVRNLNSYYKLAKKYNYRVNVVDFTKVPLEEIKERNKEREIVVPENVIDRMYKKLIETKELPKKFNQLAPQEVLSSISWKFNDANDYKKIRVIGDIHSSATPLKNLLKDFNQDTLYILTGDYFDRGVECIETMKIINGLLDKKNIIFLKGNHEKHIQDYVVDKDKTNHGFVRYTANELIKANGEKETLKFFRKLLNKLQDVEILKFNGNLIFLTHAGLTNDQLDTNEYGLHNSDYFIKGLGGYSLDIDKIFEEKVKDKHIYQIHGHRNNFLHDVTEFTHSFNLEQKVEDGNKLGAVDIVKTKDDIKIIDVSKENTKIHNATRWDKYSETINQKEYQHSKYLINKHVDGKGNITMYHFSKDAFYKGNWNAKTMSARGLYIDDTNHVIARGFNKFFVMDQREGSMRKDVIKKMVDSDQVIFSEKLDGFLGIVSYSPYDDQLLITSKTNGKAYSDFAKELLDLTLKDHGHSIEELTEFMKKDYLNGKRYSLTFEMIDEEIDPHLVEYKDKKAVLLEVIPNTLNENSLIAKNMRIHDAYNKRKELHEKFGFDLPKERIFFDLNDKESERLINGIINSEERYEGVVVTIIKNNKEFKFKLKTRYFNKMKYFRYMLENIVRILHSKDAINKNNIQLKIIDNQKEKINKMMTNEMNSDKVFVLKVVVKLLNELKKTNNTIDNFLIFSNADEPIKKIDVMKTLQKHNLSLVK